MATRRQQGARTQNNYCSNTENRKKKKRKEKRSSKHSTHERLPTRSFSYRAPISPEAVASKPARTPTRLAGRLSSLKRDISHDAGTETSSALIWQQMVTWITSANPPADNPTDRPAGTVGPTHGQSQARLSAGDTIFSHSLRYETRRLRACRHSGRGRVGVRELRPPNPNPSRQSPGM